MKNKIFEKMREYGWNLGDNTNKDFADVYDTHYKFIEGCYDYIADCDMNEPLNMNDISVSGFEDMITFMSDFLRALNDIDKPKKQIKNIRRGGIIMNLPKEITDKSGMLEYTKNKLEEDNYYYIVFVLGRDLLKGVLPYEDNLAYEFCKKVATDFEESDYNNSSKGLYECLEEYVKDNFYLKEGEITWKGEKIQ